MRTHPRTPNDDPTNNPGGMTMDVHIGALIERISVLLEAAAAAQTAWQRYRLYPDQYRVEMANAMRALESACEAFDQREDEP